ncbi:MAG: hypothetical protein EPO22_02660 [Dehalococcoidia bacterium]|nr:MAG: hypothetical protein EPO22_02660 [Dehalococcoidia bacterium]
MASTNAKAKSAPTSRRKIAARRRRVAELERNPAVTAAVRAALESERRGEGVRFEDLKPKHG